MRELANDMQRGLDTGDDSRTRGVLLHQRGVRGLLLGLRDGSGGGRLLVRVRGRRDVAVRPLYFMTEIFALNVLVFGVLADSVTLVIVALFGMVAAWVIAETKEET